MKYLARLIFCLLLVGVFTQGHGQIVNEVAKKKISIGVGLFTDVLLKFPEGVKPRTINQGFSVFGTYNVPFGKSNFGFGIGMGITTHNIYGNFLLSKLSDSTKLIKIPATVSYKRSKMSLVYLEIPVEFRFKSKSKISAGIGFKAGFLIGSSTKYVGDEGITTASGDTLHSSDKLNVRVRGIKNLESITYGPTVRIGYKWFNVNASYIISSLFNKSRGPEIVPLSIGFTLMPF